MNTVWRPLIAPAVMISAVLAGAYGVLVAPANRRLAETRAEQSAVANQLWSTQTAGARIDELAAAMRRVAEETRAIDRDSRMATDQTGVFDAITSLAMTHRVRLGRVDPLEEPAAGRRESAAIAPRARASYSIEVRGAYGAVAAFVRDLQGSLGFTMVRSVRMTPAEDGPNGETTAIIVSDHLAFDASPAKAGGGPP